MNETNIIFCKNGVKTFRMWQTCLIAENKCSASDRTKSRTPERQLRDNYCLSKKSAESDGGWADGSLNGGMRIDKHLAYQLGEEGRRDGEVE